MKDERDELDEEEFQDEGEGEGDELEDEGEEDNDGEELDEEEDEGDGNENEAENQDEHEDDDDDDAFAAEIQSNVFPLFFFCNTRSIHILFLTRIDSLEEFGLDFDDTAADNEANENGDHDEG
jgi:hypothetical protein